MRAISTTYGYCLSTAMLASLCLGWASGDSLYGDRATYEIDEILLSSKRNLVATAEETLPCGESRPVVIKIFGTRSAEFGGYQHLLRAFRGQLPPGFLPFQGFEELRLEDAASSYKVTAIIMERASALSVRPFDPNASPEEQALQVDRFENIAEHGLDRLAFLAEAHLSHNDIKPSNLLEEGGVLLLGDFGSARQTGRIPMSSTPEYRDPEISGLQGSHATSDLYSFGATLYALFMGAPPIVDYAVAHKHLTPSRQLLKRLLFDLANDPALYADYLGFISRRLAAAGEKIPRSHSPKFKNFSRLILTCLSQEPRHRLRGIAPFPHAERLTQAIHANSAFVRRNYLRHAALNCMDTLLVAVKTLGGN